jgi:hypothetical protein
MEATRKRNIKNGSEYDRLFPNSEGDNKTIRKNANVSDTVAFIPKVVHETLDQTKAVARLLNGKSVYETCANTWHFVYQHINYKKDQDGYEQIRSPARAWRDRKHGVDCDCYSTFISSILTNLGIPHLLRITKYHRKYFQHIYPVVKNGNKEIIIDCVTDKFDYEVPYSEKKDYPMDLQYLNGFDGDGMEELGKVLKRNMAKNKSVSLPKAAKKIKKKSNLKTTTASGSSVPAVKKKKGLLKKVVSKINKINPATILLRNGVLASMKLNVKNVAGRLKWSYLSPEQAAAKGIDPAKFQKLLATRQKLENIFTTAGGKADNLKKAILGGKGNKDKAVNGLGMLPIVEWSPYLNEYTPIDQLLGPETYYSENVEGMEGLGQLGEPITLTSIAAAAGVIAGIVSALKQVGDIFGGKGNGSEDFDETKTDAPENNVNASASNASTQIQDSTTNRIISTNTTSENFNESSSQDDYSSNAIAKSSESNFSLVTDEPIENDIATPGNSVSNTTADSKNDPSKTPDDKESFWDKNKTWLKPVAIGVGGLTLIAVGFHLMKGKPHNKSSSLHSLSGVPHKRKKKKKHHRKHKSKHKHKTAIALL